MSINIETFKKDPYKLISLKNKNMIVKLTNIGASIVSILLKDKNNHQTDIVLGFDSPYGYLNNPCCLGATIGRNANRIENALLKIDDKIYKLDKNDGENNLHSGFNKTSELIWNYKINNDNNSITFYTLLKDGFQNMEGNFHVNVCYELKKNNSLCITYSGKCDKKTIANFTNHTYFNLDGHETNNILSQKVMINATKFTSFKENTSIPSGELKKVHNTPMDFTQFKEIGQDINSNYDQLKFANGYDHNFVINKEPHKELSLISKAYSDKTGILLETYSDLPGVQFYTGNFNNVTKFCKNNAKYLFRSGFCFETQYFPNCYNIDSFEKPILNPNELYKTSTIYKFSIKDSL